MAPSRLWLLALLGHLLLASGQNPIEQNALVQFYKGITPKGFAWDTNSPLCEQTGVYCYDGSVNAIILIGMLSGGTISSYLGQLSSLDTLRLEKNHLSGTIPTELGRQLSVLILYSNSLSGTIPTEIGNMSLDYFALFSNSLSGTIPTELGRLKNVIEMLMNSNSLSGTIPTELADLAKLEFLELQDNHLSGTIPSELGARKIATMYLAGTNHFCPLTDYSEWAYGTDSPYDLTCEACGASFPLCQSGETCLGGVNETFTCAGSHCPISFGTESLELAPGQVADIQISLGSDAGGEVTVNLESNCALLSACSLTFDSSNFGTPQIVTVTGGTSNPATVCYVRASTEGETCTGAQVEITQPDEPSDGQGMVYGDPSLVTFSFTRYQVRRRGFLTLLQTADGGFAAQLRTGRCEKKGTCAFELAVQKGTFMATLSMDLEGNLVQQTTGNEGENGVALLTQGAHYRYHLTTGLRISARAGFTPSSQQYALMVVVSASSSYRSQLAGLLGSFNGEKNGDLLLPDGSMAADTPSFVKAWRVTNDSENMFLSFPTPIDISPVSGISPFDHSTVDFGCQA